jgi:hypothetical protein
VQALKLLYTVIRLRSKQHPLKGICPSTFSKAERRKLLLKAAEQQDIDFYHLTMPQRQQLIEQVLGVHKNDRKINLVVAHFLSC